MGSFRHFLCRCRKKWCDISWSLLKNHYELKKNDFYCVIKHNFYAISGF